MADLPNTITVNKAPALSTVFPLDYEATSGHILLFKEYKYSRPSKDANWKKNPTGVELGLPVPTNLDTTYTADWETMSLGSYNNFLQTKIAPYAEGAIRAGAMAADQGKGVTGIAKSVIDSFGTTQGANGKELMSGFLSALAVDATTDTQAFKAIGMTAGLARNPFQAAIFNSMAFRQFQFSYKFMPKSFEESEMLFKIIKQFKMSMHPSLNETLTNNLLEYPNVWGLSFSKNKYLFNFGMCVLTDCNINYHAEGVPSYFEKNGEKLPTSVGINVTFREVEANTRETIRDEGR